MGQHDVVQATCVLRIACGGNDTRNACYSIPNIHKTG